MRIYHLFYGQYPILYAAISLLNYNVITNERLALLNSAETKIKTSSLVQCAVLASSSAYFLAEYDRKTTTCVLSNSHFLRTVPGIGFNVLQLQGKERPLYDCSDLPFNSASGIYQINPRSFNYTINVFCEMNAASSGWTIVSNRFDGSVNFDREWQDYKTGFGNLAGEFWLGNENIYRITSNIQYQVMFDMVDVGGERAYASYSTFGVADEITNYTLTLSGYSGTAGDSMLNNLLESLGGRQFITKDRNPWCPTKRKSGWWYSGCSQCNVLGLYNPGEWGEEYLIWKTWRSRTCLSKMTMMIKPLFTVP